MVRPDAVLGILALIASLEICVCSRILGLFTAPSKSHLVINMAIVEGLVERGHDVTVITAYTVDNKNSSFRHIQVDTIPQMPHTAVPSIVKSLPTPLASVLGIHMVSLAVAPVHNKSLDHPDVQALMDNESFDLVILGYFFNDFQLGVAAHFKCPVVVSWTVRPVLFTQNLVGLPRELLYVPTLFSELKQPLGFIDRVKNLFYYGFELACAYSVNQMMETYYKSRFPPDKYPTLDEMRKNVSLLFVSHHFSEGPIYPTVPGLIEIGGIQAKEKPEALPTDVQKFLDDAKDGAIFFSFGSNFATTRIDPIVIQAMFNVFSELKQHVLLKWDADNLTRNASNILYKSWLSQDDILAHPNTKLFITHGGKGSVSEAQYHGIPIVGIPLFGDQIGNIKVVIEAGLGVCLQLMDLTEESLRKAITEVLDNSKYRENAQRLSKLYRDRPMSAKETAVYWIEYVIRHRGAKHLQSPAIHLNLFQYYGLDVISAIIFVIYIGWRILKGIGKLLKRIVGSKIKLE